MEIPTRIKGFSPILIIIVIGLIAGFSYLGYLNLNLNQSSPLPTASAEPTLQAEVSPTPEPEFDYHASVLDLLKKVLRKEVSYKTLDEGVTGYEYDELGVYAYQYQKGGLVTRGFEGFIWEINLDTEIDSFKNLRLGEQTATTCYVNGCEEADVEVSELGSRKWAFVRYRLIEYMSYYPYRRVYYTFDEPSQQLIYVEVGFEKEENEETVSQKFETEVLEKL